MASTLRQSKYRLQIQHAFVLHFMQIKRTGHNYFMEKNCTLNKTFLLISCMCLKIYGKCYILLLRMATLIKSSTFQVT
jgi:hypothetical protein